jgi:D-beta-D-heptose 7-phosphate kinase/D-beta-D-heptose 1-phosphate adenosyltransferase
VKLPSLESVHVLVLGDVMLDRYWIGAARRVSPEAPVPVVDVQRTEDRPGGAANVALNVASLGARCTLIGAVAADEAADVLTARLTAAGVDCRFVHVPDWQTAIKLRIVSQNQQLLRTDFESPLPDAAAAQLLPVFTALLPAVTAVVLQDYDKGALAAPEPFIAAARAAGVPVIVDPKHKPLSRYAGADILKPNAQEFAAQVRLDVAAEGPVLAGDDAARADRGTAASAETAAAAELLARGAALCARCDLNALVVTRGARGMTAITRAGQHRHIPALPVEVYDVTGAGDTAAAALAVTRSLGWDPVTCAEVANVASGIAVGKSGTAAVTGPELARGLASAAPKDRGILDPAALLERVAEARAAGARIVFTNGCFDILHAGHVAYLEEARALGDRLVVAVNDDAGVRRLKGPGRPVNALDRRQRVLAGLASVDWVTAFAEDTPEALLERLRPDVLVKGGDYSTSEVVGADLVRRHGGDVRVLGLVEDCSTTAIVARVKGDVGTSGPA